MEPDRLDLSALDPSRDPERWERLVRSVASRGLARARLGGGVRAQLVAWWRPALALAAAAVALAWLPSLLPAPRAATSVADPVLSTTSWLLRERSPETAAALASIGVDHVSR